MHGDDKPTTSTNALADMLARAKAASEAAPRVEADDSLSEAIYEAEAAIAWFRARCEDKGLLTKDGSVATGERAWREALRADAQFGHTGLWYDERFECSVVDGERLDDMAVMRLRERLADVYRAKCDHQRACLVIEQVAREVKCVDPVVEYLDEVGAMVCGPSLSAARIGLGVDGSAIDCLCKVMGAEGICAVYVRKWLIGAVARARNPACKMDTCLVLSGPQGVGKSTLFQALVPDEAWAMEYRKPIGHQDFEVDTSGPWIVDLSELSSARGREAEEIKAALSSVQDSYRPKYKALGVVRRRRFVFAGTTNRGEFLTDATGNRRFWVVFVGQRGALDVGAVVGLRDAVWAEASAAFSAGEPWWLTREEQEQADEQTKQAEEEGAWDAIVAKLLDSPQFVGDDFIGTLQVAEAIRGSAAAVQVRDRHLVSEAMQRLGWERKQRKIDGKNQRGWERPIPF